MTTSPLLTGADYLALPRDAHTWILKPLLPVSGAMTIFGEAKVGKSFLSIQLALALSGAESQQRSWLGFPVIRPGPVAYIQLDTPRSLWADRLATINDPGIDHLYLADRETLGAYPFDILQPAHAHLLHEALAPLTLGVVILDTMREVHAGDENDSTVMRQVVATLMAVIAPAALVLVSHAKKPHIDAPPNLMADQRGSSYIVGRMDSIIRLGKRTLHYSGRAIEEASLRLTRLDNGFWAVKMEEVDQLTQAVIDDPALPSISAKARALSQKVDKSEEACRSLIRRHLG